MNADDSHSEQFAQTIIAIAVAVMDWKLQQKSRKAFKLASSQVRRDCTRQTCASVECFRSSLTSM